MSAVQKQVRFPREYFAKALLEYSDWRWALFREFIQNALDAGADAIGFAIHVAAGNKIVIQVTDNGCGMSRDTIENVLLVGGGSQKPAGAVGGFGYAKALLYFAHETYTIYSRISKVVGCGGDYTIEEIPAVAGSQMVITFDGDESEYHRLSDILRTYVSFMRYTKRASFYLNGDELPSDYSDFTFKVETELGSLLFKDVTNSQSKLIVSVNGLPMFVHNVYTSGVDAFTGVLELKGKTFEILTTNRDSLKGEYSARLTRIVQRMIEQRFSYKMGKSVDITLNWTKPELNADEGPMTEQRYNFVPDDVNSIRYMNNEVFPHNFNIRIQSLVGQKTADHSDQTIPVNTVLSMLKKQWVQRMATCWKYIVYEILRSTYIEHFGVVECEDGLTEFYLGEQRIVTGFIFADKIEGINIKEQHEILIMCNPMAFDKDYSIPDLCDLAIHEVAHLISSGHNDHFIDADMKTRQSLRRRVDEAELTSEVKQMVKDWRADRIDQL